VITFEEWLIGQTAAARPRGDLAQLMLDGRAGEIDLGSRSNRDALRRLMDDFERDAQGQWVQAAPLPARARTAAGRLGSRQR
jgi:hypothetical protein